MPDVPFYTATLSNGQTKVLQKSQVVSVDRSPKGTGNDHSKLILATGEELHVVGTVAVVSAALVLAEA